MPAMSEWEAAQKVKGWIKEISYKPGTKVDLELLNDKYHIVVDLPTLELNPRKKKKETHVSLYRPVHVEGMTRGGLFYYVYQMIKELEEHEIDEWFIANGKHWQHPHPDIKGYKGRKAYV